jgi:hypothetical protein
MKEKKNNKKKYIAGGKFGELLNNFLVSSAYQLKDQGNKLKNTLENTINPQSPPPKNIQQGGKKKILKKNKG